MDTKDLLKLAASAPIALASSGAAYVAATAETGATDAKVETLAAKLDSAMVTIQQLEEREKAYTYMLQKAENELAVLKAKK